MREMGEKTHTDWLSLCLERLSISTIRLNRSITVLVRNWRTTMTDETEITINSEIERLKAEYPILADRAPLAIGIRSVLKPLINLSSQKRHRSVLKPLINLSSQKRHRAIYFICSDRKYLKNISAGGSRHNLDGSINGEVTTEQAGHAKEKLIAMSKQARKPKQPKK